MGEKENRWVDQSLYEKYGTIEIENSHLHTTFDFTWLQRTFFSRVHFNWDTKKNEFEIMWEGGWNRTKNESKNIEKERERRILFKVVF